MNNLYASTKEERDLKHGIPPKVNSYTLYLESLSFGDEGPAPKLQLIETIRSSNNKKQFHILSCGPLFYLSDQPFILGEGGIANILYSTHKLKRIKDHVELLIKNINQ